MRSRLGPQASQPQRPRVSQTNRQTDRSYLSPFWQEQACGVPALVEQSCKPIIACIMYICCQQQPRQLCSCMSTTPRIILHQCFFEIIFLHFGFTWATLNRASGERFVTGRGRHSSPLSNIGNAVSQAWATSLAMQGPHHDMGRVSLGDRFRRL